MSKFIAIFIITNLFDLLYTHEMLLIMNFVGADLMARLIFNFPSRQRPVGKASHFSLVLLCIAGNGELRVNELPCVTYHFYPTRFRGPLDPGDIQDVPESRVTFDLLFLYIIIGE